MNHRERFFKALELEEPDFVPITDLALDPPIVEAILDKNCLVWFSLWLVEAPAGFSLNYRLAMIEACKKLNFDAVCALSDYSLTTRDYKPTYIDEKRYVDYWGRVMQTSVRAKTTYFVGGTINSPEDLENYEPPDASHPDIIEMIERIMKATRKEDFALIEQCTAAGIYPSK